MKVDEHRLVLVRYKNIQLDIDIRPQLSYLENPIELINKAEEATEKGIWSLMQFTEQLWRQYGKEPRSMEMLSKKLYIRRMAADLGISKTYTVIPWEDGWYENNNELNGFQAYSGVYAY